MSQRKLTRQGIGVKPDVVACAKKDPDQFRILEQREFKKLSISRPIAAVFLLVLLFGGYWNIIKGCISLLAPLFFGETAMNTEAMLEAAGGLVAVMLIIPLSDLFEKHIEVVKYRYWLAITDKGLLYTIAPKSYIEKVDKKEFVNKHKGENISELYNNYRKALREAMERSSDNLKQGLKRDSISREFSVSVKKPYIILTSHEKELIIPYDKKALRFLKDIALISEKNVPNKTNES